MVCPKCRRSTPQHRAQCLYCGAALSPGDSMLETGGGNGSEDLEQQARQAVLDALPESLRREVEAALDESRIQTETTAEEQTVSNSFQFKEQGPFQPTSAPRAGDNILQTLEIARKHFDADTFDYDEYRQAVINALIGHIDQMENSTKLNYILNDIKGNPEFDYLEDDMLKDLQRYVVSAVSGAKPPASSDGTRRFSFRKLWRKK